MKLVKNTKLVTLLMACVLAAGLLGGCATQASTAASTAQSENRAYMNDVNQIMEKLQSRLGSFTDAVSRGDVVTMRTQADNAFKALDQLDELDAPDALDDVEKAYEEGSADLKEALNDYIDLYTEIQSATDDSPFDWSSYDQRIADIKSLYDNGIEALESGDEEAAKLPA